MPAMDFLETVKSPHAAVTAATAVTLPTILIYQSCSGDCASVTLQTTIAGNQHNATLYVCDPTSVCQALSTYRL
ncbi:ET module [Ancylostoma duodenale]|uniref:ET module n=1 Tax=Ancylostoma duodenale TaxID=51022 RepID=A0A0C2FF99_9BILA|nr:ET module [Ancylostoma duodenale]